MTPRTLSKCLKFVRYCKVNSQLTARDQFNILVLRNAENVKCGASIALKFLISQIL